MELQKAVIKAASNVAEDTFFDAYSTGRKWNAEQNLNCHMHNPSIGLKQQTYFRSHFSSRRLSVCVEEVRRPWLAERCIQFSVEKF